MNAVEGPALAKPATQGVSDPAYAAEVERKIEAEDRTWLAWFLSTLSEEDRVWYEKWLKQRAEYKKNCELWAERRQRLHEEWKDWKP